MFLELLFIVTLIISVTKIFAGRKDNVSSEKILEKISENIEIQGDDKYKIDFIGLKNTNKDTVGWIKLNGTKIEYPVVQGDDNKYYLTHSFDKTPNSAGWVFADYRNKFDGTDKNIIIYGHNRRNDSMFGTLKNILKKEWYENNKYVTFITQKEDIKYEVFSVYQIKEEDYYITTDFKNEEFKEFISTIKKRSIKDFGVKVSEKDSILTLSSCANDSKYRIVLHSKRVK